MKAIWKFPILIDDEYMSAMPRGAEVISAVLSPRDPNRIDVYAVADPGHPMVGRKFLVEGTGHPLEDGATYVATVLQPPFVWHVFDAGEVDE